MSRYQAEIDFICANTLSENIVKFKAAALGHDEFDECRQGVIASLDVDNVKESVDSLTLQELAVLKDIVCTDMAHGCG